MSVQSGLWATTHMSHLCNVEGTDTHVHYICFSICLSVSFSLLCSSFVDIPLSLHVLSSVSVTISSRFVSVSPSLCLYTLSPWLICLFPSLCCLSVSLSLSLFSVPCFYVPLSLPAFSPTSFSLCFCLFFISVFLTLSVCLSVSCQGIN